MTDSDRAEDVLMEFSAEPVQDRATLERYLRDHPMLAVELVDLSLELRLQRASIDASTPADEAWIDASWEAFRSGMTVATRATPATDPFAALSSAALVVLRRNLGVPSGVVQGFRTRIVDVATVPERFLRSLAGELGASTDEVCAFLAGPPRLGTGLSYKSDAPPAVEPSRISFEQLLLDTRVPDADRIRLLLDEG